MTDDKAEWDYKPDGETKVNEPRLDGRGSRPAANKVDGPTSVEWQGHEFIDHKRGAGWYLALAAATVVLTGVIYLLTKDYFAAAVVVITAIVLILFTLQKPRQTTYNLSPDGLRIGDKLYTYGHFKSFSVIREVEGSSIHLLPIKRFLPVISLYYERADEVKIVQVLGQHLPYENRGPDTIDRLTRRLRL